MPVPSKTLLDNVAKALAKKAAKNRQGQLLPNVPGTMQFERRFDLAPRRPDMRDVRRGVGIPAPETNYNWRDLFAK